MNRTPVLFIALLTTVSLLAIAPAGAAYDLPSFCVDGKGTTEYCGANEVRVCVDDQTCIGGTIQCVVGPCDPLPP